MREFQNNDLLSKIFIANSMWYYLYQAIDQNYTLTSEIIWNIAIQYIKYLGSALVKLRYSSKGRHTPNNDLRKKKLEIMLCHINNAKDMKLCMHVGFHIYNGIQLRLSIGHKPALTYDDYTTLGQKLYYMFFLDCPQLFYKHF